MSFMKKTALSTAFVTMGLVSTAASAAIETITFDTLPAQVGHSYSVVQNGYAGLNWSQLAVVDTVLLTASTGNTGYANSAVSGRNAAFNEWGTPATISARSSSGFTLYNGYFTAGWNNGLNVQAVGTFENGTTATSNFILNTTGPTNEVFSWSNLASVTFTSSGGINPGFSGGGIHFALDNLTVNPVSAVPEAEEWALMLAGLSLVGWKLRNKKANVAHAVA